MADKVHIPDDEYAVKLTQDISGGLGNHAKDTVLRGLSLAAYTTLVGSGFAKRVKSTAAGEVVDYETKGADPEAPATVDVPPAGRRATT